MPQAAASYASRLNPLEAVFLSILLEHQKALDDLKARLVQATRGEPARPEPGTSPGEGQPDL